MPDFGTHIYRLTWEGKLTLRQFDQVRKLFADTDIGLSELDGTYVLVNDQWAYARQAVHLLTRTLHKHVGMEEVRSGDD